MDLKVKKYNNIPDNIPLEEVEGKVNNITHLARDYECHDTVIRVVFYEAELPDDLTGEAFTWDPIDRKIRDVSPSEYKRLEPRFKVITLHSYAFEGFFKPTVAEVINQISGYLAMNTYPNEKVLIQTCVYEHPTKSHYSESIIGDYHMAVTYVYEYPKHQDDSEPPKKIMRTK
jgi:hypothetical protein